MITTPPLTVGEVPDAADADEILLALEQQRNQPVPERAGTPRGSAHLQAPPPISTRGGSTAVRPAGALRRRGARARVGARGRVRERMAVGSRWRAVALISVLALAVAGLAAIVIIPTRGSPDQPLASGLSARAGRVTAAESIAPTGFTGAFVALSRQRAILAMLAASGPRHNRAPTSAGRAIRSGSRGGHASSASGSRHPSTLEAAPPAASDSAEGHAATSVVASLTPVADTPASTSTQPSGANDQDSTANSDNGRGGGAGPSGATQSRQSRRRGRRCHWYVVERLGSGGGSERVAALLSRSAWLLRMRRHVWAAG